MPKDKAGREPGTPGYGTPAAHEEHAPDEIPYAMTHAGFRAHVGKIHPGEDIASRRARESLRHELIRTHVGSGVKAEKARRREMQRLATQARDAEGIAPDRIPVDFLGRRRKKGSGNG